MTQTEELRQMLDERGVEYLRHEDGEPLRELKEAGEPATSWHMGGASVCAVPIDGGELFDLWIDHCTPEQAVEATLGRGTCRVESVARNEYGYAPQVSDYTFELSCGHSVTWDEQPDYCPWCGRRVVE